MKKITLVLFLVPLLFPPTTWPVEGYKCNTQGNQAELNTCAEDDFSDADGQLNEAYKKLLAHQTFEEQETVKKEQRVWLKERDPKCRAEANSEAQGGSMWPMIFNGCRAKLTKQRTEQLLNYYSVLAIIDSKPLFGVWASNHAKMPHTMIIRGHDLVWRIGSKNEPSCKTTYGLVEEYTSDTYPNNTFGVLPDRTFKVYKLKLAPQRCFGDLAYIQLAIPNISDERYTDIIWYNKEHKYFGYVNYSRIH